MTKRFEILDVLKGFSLFAILILHFLQQFEVENNYVYSINFFNKIDKILKDVITSFFSGNVYLIFSLIFGINLNFGLKNKSNSKFLVRLLLIFIIGYLHSILYVGDILIFYAILGVILLFLNKFNNKTLYIILIITLTQIPLFFLLFQTTYRNYQLVTSYDINIINEMLSTFSSKNFLDVVEFNLNKGKYLSIKQYLFSGRFLNIFSFFIIGLLIYKNDLLAKLENKKSQITKILFISLILSIIFFFIKKNNYSDNIHIGLSIKLLIDSFSSIISSIFYISLITYLFYFKNINFNFFKIYGKASLTIYLTQSIFGILLFYHFGLNLGNKISILHGLLLALIVLFVQYYFIFYWFKKYKKGPFEMFLEYILNRIKV